MTIIGYEGCPKCEKLKKDFPHFRYIQIPDIQVGFGDTICAFTCFLGITPCRRCRIRQNWCNKWIPYPWNKKKIAADILEVKRKVLALGVKTFPVFIEDDFTKIYPQ